MTGTISNDPASDPSPPPSGEPRGEIAGGAWRLALVSVGTAAFGVLLGLSFLIVILAVVVMIFLHELGHYLTAKWGGMKVTEFFIGFGPKLWSFRRGETEYGLKAIPAGAYVRIIGMHNLEEIAAADEPRTYRQQSYPRRMAVALAGSTMHFVQAFLLLFAVYAFSSVPGGELFSDTPADEVSAWHVGTVGPESAAADAGVREGDTIVAFDNTAIADFSDVRTFVTDRPGDVVTITVLRDGSEVRLPATIGTNDDRPGQGFLGVGLALDRVDYGLIEAVPEAAQSMGSGMRLGVTALADFFTPDSLGNFFGQVTPDDPPEVAPSEPAAPAPAPTDDGDGDRLLSIYGAVRLGADLTDAGWRGLAIFLININIFVGIFNLIPLLPLDGGHVAIATYERIRSRPGRRYFVDVNKLLPLTYAVVMFLVVLGVTSLYLDITDPIRIG